MRLFGDNGWEQILGLWWIVAFIYGILSSDRGWSSRHGRTHLGGVIKGIALGFLGTFVIVFLIKIFH